MSGRRRPKIEALIVNAIRKLQDAQGLTPREISNYITQEYDVPGTEIKKQVHLALKRGVSYGILRKYKGRCGTSEFNEMEAISKQPRPNSGDDDDNNSRNESISDRSSLTDPDGSMQDPRPNTPPSTHME
uniref:H15 domain-containing protein n=1 Tax=Vespula pensylvanica TaxID=30213 RepID=A0A834NYN1_VESPE|nr:hypothetical protein H0235_009390 [Vespula pensylvanica]